MSEREEEERDFGGFRYVNIGIIRTWMLMTGEEVPGRMYNQHVQTSGSDPPTDTHKL